jgi:HNH endonuclease/NUMOD4 motif
MAIERWMWVVGFEGFYKISTFGRVKSAMRKRGKGWRTVFRGCWGFKQFSEHYGYKTVVLSKNGRNKRAFVHRLVLEAFVGPCPVGLECCHRDHVKSNNCLQNLRWDTRENNYMDSIIRDVKERVSLLKPAQDGGVLRGMCWENGGGL